MAHNFDGQVYRKFAIHQRAWGEKLASELELAGNERILDLGCGDGLVTGALASRVPRGSVHGIDASAGMLAATEPFHAANITWQQMDITDIAFENEFDVIYSNAALHWVHDHQRLLAACHRALRPGGRIRFNFAGSGNCPAMIAATRHQMQTPEWAQAFADFVWPWIMPSIAEYQALLAQSPFGRGQVWDQPEDKIYPTAEALDGWMRNPCLVPFADHLAAKVGDSAAEAFCQKAVSYMTGRCAQGNGSFVEHYVRLNVSARKA